MTRTADDRSLASAGMSGTGTMTGAGHWLNGASRLGLMAGLLGGLLVLGACEPAADQPSSPSEAVEEGAPAKDMASEGVWPHDASDIPADPAVTYGTLDSGLRYAVMQNNTPTNSISMRLYVGSGSLDERDDQQGLAHFLEHMAFKGSENMPGDEVVKFLERLGLAFGPDTNAFTSFDQTVYQLELPDADLSLMRQGMEIFREYAGRLTLDSEAIDKERGVILSEKRFRNTPGFRRVQALYGFLAPDSLLVRRWPIGTEEVIKNAPREAFADFYTDYYRPDNMMVAVVGDAQPGVAEGLIREIFADYTVEGTLPPEPALKPISHDAPRTGHFFDPDVSTQVQIFGVGPARNQDDTAATRRDRLLRSLGNAIVSRRLETLSRKEDAVFLGGGAGDFDLEKAADVAFLSLTTEAAQWSETLALGEQELRRALEHGFTAAELAEQLATIENALKNAVEEADTRESGALAGALVAHVHEDEVFSNPQTDLALFQEASAGLTPDMVHAAFREMWDGRAPQIFLSGNLSIEDADQAIMAAFEDRRAVAVEPPTEEAAVDFAYTEFGEPGAIAERSHVEDLDIHQVRFENNVRLNIKQTDFEADTVRIVVRVGSGMLTMSEDKPRLDLLADEAFLAGGLEAHSADEVQRLFAGKTVGLDFSAGLETFQLAGTTDPEDLDNQFNLMTAAVTAPGFRAEALSQFRKSVGIFYETIDATPDGIVSRDVDRIVHGGDHRYGLPEQAVLESYTLEDVKAWMGDPLASGPIEIGVVGDVDPEQVIAAVARTFGALNERSAESPSYDESRNVAFPDDLSEPVILRHEGDANRASSSVYWRTTDAQERIVARRMTLLSRVLQLKLTEAVRRDAGATYSPRVWTAMSDVFPDYGFMAASLDLDPVETEAFLKTLTDIAGTMATDGISDDEFQRAQAPLVEALEEQFERNVFWLYSAVAEAQSAPEKLDHVRSLQTDYADMTKAEVEEVARTYLADPVTAQFIILPPEEIQEAGEDAETGGE